MLGVLDDSRPSDLFTPDTGEPVRPGKAAPLLLATGPVLTAAGPGKTPPTQEEVVAATILAGAERERERAKRLAADMRSAMTMAALAQTHAVLGERAEALDAAREALALGLASTTDRGGSIRLADAVSARIAAEVMLRFDSAEEAYAALCCLELPRSLRLTLAAIAVELGRIVEAMDALSGQVGPMVESFRGFLLTAQGEFQRAIPHLRAALRESPEDVAAAMNLSVSLLGVGSPRKAVAAALQASRTAPGREDASLHYLELLLETGDLRRLTQEVSALNDRKVIATARFLVIQARALIAKNEPARALPLLNKALTAAVADGDGPLRIEIEVNLAVMRFQLGRQTYEKTMEVLSTTLRDHPDNEVVVLSFARVASQANAAPTLRRAIECVEARTTPARRAFLLHQVAWLEGDNAAVAQAASAWFDQEPRNALAASAAMVALGIGVERWREAEKVADFALAHFPDDLSVVNNAAYVLAMVGRAHEAISLLEPRAVESFIPKATLGLACLASGDIDRGMRLYREAAREADKANRTWLSLMTTYQALVVRQLGIDRNESAERISALALAPCPLPADWEEQTEFVRLRNLCQQLGYPWPLNL